MAISINWLIKRIYIQISDLTLIAGTLYELDTNWFRLQLKDIEDSEEGIVNLDMHIHTTSYTVAGITYARSVRIINGFSVEFEDGAYSVKLTGSNNDIFDIQSGILVQNQVQVIPTNAAGLIVSGSALTTEQATTLAWLKRRLEGDELREPNRLIVTDKDTAEVLVDKDVSGSSQVTTIAITDH